MAMMTYRTYSTWPFSVRSAPNLSSQPRGFTEGLYQRPAATPGLLAERRRGTSSNRPQTPVISRGPEPLRARGSAVELRINPADDDLA